jgi:methylmalonyl-CoA mutase cobalamin-binding subunit
VGRGEGCVGEWGCGGSIAPGQTTDDDDMAFDGIYSGAWD